MRIDRVIVAALAAALAALPALAPRGAVAESTATFANGQKLAGTVPPDEVIRLRFPVPKDGEPRLNFSLKGSNIPVSFNRSDIYDPDGNLIPDTSRFFLGTRVRPRKSTLKLRDFVAPKSGMYTLVIETNAARIPGIVELVVSGRLKVKRPTKIRLRRDETEPVIGVGLATGERVSVKVKRVTGDLPQIDRYTSPLGSVAFPITESRRTKKGSVSRTFTAVANDVHTFTIGYRDGGVSGAFDAVVKITPFRGGTAAQMRLANAPGIPLSVRGIDRSTTLTFGTGAPGISYDGSFFLLTARRTGPGQPDIAGRFFDRDLLEQPGTQVPISIVGPADMQPGAQVGGHRSVFMAGHHVTAWWTVDGRNAGLERRRTDMTRANFVELFTAAANPVVDPFLTSDGTRLSFGVFEPPSGHLVYLRDADLTRVAEVAIGGGALAHGNGAGAAFHDDDDAPFFDLWAPESNTFGQASDLHRQRYSPTWQSLGPETRPVADPQVQESMSTAVVLDPVTEATIVHYVVPEAASGAGRVRRVIFDAAGVEVPGSRTILAGSGRNRPTAVIVGAYLYLGVETAGAPVIERFPLLR